MLKYDPEYRYYLYEVSELLCHCCYAGVEFWIRTHNIPQEALLYATYGMSEIGEDLLEILLESYPPRDKEHLVDLFYRWADWLPKRPKDYEYTHDLEYFMADMAMVGVFFRHGLTCKDLGDRYLPWIPILQQWYQYCATMEPSWKRRKIAVQLRFDRFGERSSCSGFLRQLWDQAKILALEHD